MIKCLLYISAYFIGCVSFATEKNDQIRMTGKTKVVSLDSQRNVSQNKEVPEKDDKQASYQIHPGSVYDTSNLRDGDIIQSVDGNKIDDPEKALQMLNDRSKATQDVRIIRNGREQSLKINQDPPTNDSLSLISGYLNALSTYLGPIIIK